jgi:hypothetical protein
VLISCLYKSIHKERVPGQATDLKPTIGLTHLRPHISWQEGHLEVNHVMDIRDGGDRGQRLKQQRTHASTLHDITASECKYTCQASLPRMHLWTIGSDMEMLQIQVQATCTG